VNSPEHPFLKPLGRSLVLASKSPRRSLILKQHGLQFEMLPAELDETPAAGEDPRDYVTRLGQQKARWAAARRPSSVCVGCDTVVLLDGEMLGKPANAQEACDTLSRLAGNEHLVLSSLAMVQAEEEFRRVGLQETRVGFRSLSPAEIEAYVATGEPFDKAGGYGIQGFGSMLVSWIQGCYFNVMGLPLEVLRRLWCEYLESKTD
jgi:septum formation protein